MTGATNSSAQGTIPLEEIARQVGFDTQRLWCTGFTLSKGDGVTLIVVKENLNSLQPDGTTLPLERNIASLIMPEGAAIGLRDALMQIFPVGQP